MVKKTKHNNRAKPSQNKTRKIRKNVLSNKDSLVFFDDDFYGNINPFRQSFPLIKSILVPDKPYNQILHGKPDFYYPMMFLKKYKNNKYAQELVKGMTIEKSFNVCDECLNSTGQGISIKEMKQIIKWSNKHSIKSRIVFFDWDKTISVCNGIFLPENTNKQYNFTNDFSPVDIAQYLAGTKERFDALQFMFFHLRKNGVDCKIFTNNGWGNLVKGREQDFQFFLNIARVFDPQMKDDDIIYGNRNKEKTFKENAGLMKLYKSI
jgi:hypothetical protein